MSLENFDIIPDTVPEAQEEPKLGGFQNPNYLTNPEAVMIAIHDVGGDQGLTAADFEVARAVGDTNFDLQRLANEVQEAQDDLYNAEARLQEAMARGGSVLTLMSTVETCRSILETRQRMYNDAVAAANAAPLAAKEGEVKFGSVEHKQWELETAIKNGNKIAAEHRARDLAKEIAKEAAKEAAKKAQKK